jgi:hypothetical protein
LHGALGAVSIASSGTNAAGGDDVKRVALIRRSPLRARNPMKRWFRPEEDKVSPEDRAAVFARDEMCIAARTDPTHSCRDQWGEPHAPTDTKKLTLDHVHDHAMMGRRAPSDVGHLVAACWAANVLGWCSKNRHIERAWLAEVQPGA